MDRSLRNDAEWDWEEECEAIPVRIYPPTTQEVTITYDWIRMKSKAIRHKFEGLFFGKLSLESSDDLTTIKPKKTDQHSLSAVPDEIKALQIYFDLFFHHFIRWNRFRKKTKLEIIRL